MPDGSRTAIVLANTSAASSPLLWKSMCPPGVQKRMRVIALTMTRRRSQPASVSLQAAGSLPHMRAMNST